MFTLLLLLMVLFLDHVTFTGNGWGFICYMLYSVVIVELCELCCCASCLSCLMVFNG